MDSRSVATLAPLGGWTDDWTPQRRCTPRLPPHRGQDRLFTITDLGVHDGPIQVFTMLRNTQHGGGIAGAALGPYGL